MPLRVLSVNFHSRIGKRAQTQFIIQRVKPDIIIGVENHIDEKSSPLDCEAAIGLSPALYKTLEKIEIFMEEQSLYPSVLV